MKVEARCEVEYSQQVGHISQYAGFRRSSNAHQEKTVIRDTDGRNLEMRNDNVFLLTYHDQTHKKSERVRMIIISSRC